MRRFIENFNTSFIEIESWSLQSIEHVPNQEETTAIEVQLQVNFSHPYEISTEIE